MPGRERTMDHAAADALKIYIDNDVDLYRQQTTSIIRNLVTRMAKDEYDHDKAAKLFGYLVESGAKKYVKDERGSLPWHKRFPTDVRRKVAAELADYFLAEAKLGEYDSMLPKKYQSAAAAAIVPATRAARRPKSKAEMEREIRSVVVPARSPRLSRARQRANFGRPPG